MTADEPSTQGLSAVQPAGRNMISLSTVDELRRLQSVTDAALEHLTVDALMDELLDRVRDALSADTAAILLIDETGSDLVARAAKGLEEEVRQGVRIPIGQGVRGDRGCHRRSHGDRGGQ